MTRLVAWREHWTIEPTEPDEDGNRWQQLEQAASRYFIDGVEVTRETADAFHAAHPGDWIGYNMMIERPAE